MSYPTKSQIEAVMKKEPGPKFYFTPDPGPVSFKPISGDRIQSYTPHTLIIDYKPRDPTND
jgi:hypothetical protein